MVNIWKRGEITVFVSLLLVVILVFFQAAFQSSRNAMLRTEVEESLELAEYSLLSEYNKELLDTYSLFYLDLGYGGGAEDSDYVNERLSEFLNLNISDGETEGVETWSFARATDEEGTGYYEQAVAFMKDKTGASILERLQEYVDYAEISEKYSDEYEDTDASETQNLEELVRRREEEEEVSTPDPVSNTNSLKATSILNLVVADTDKLSGKQADLSESPSNRTLLSGSGARGINTPGVTNDLFFLAYLMEFFPDSVDYLAEDEESSAWLDYQLEYIIAGNDSDIANLEAVCNRILLIREGMNFIYLIKDSAKCAECEALATTIIGATVNPLLIEALKYVLLLAWAYAESLVDVRLLLSGKKVAFYKSDSSWKLSLSGALELTDLADADYDGDDGGFDYSDYLGILLAATARTDKTMRSLDAIEGVVRENSGGTYFYVDQCVDSFWMRTVCTNGSTEYSAERWFCYEW